MKDIPLLLRDKIAPSIDVNDIMGFHYWVDYETTDWDCPIDNSHFDEELFMNDGTYRLCLEFRDYYCRNGKHNSLSLSLNSAVIEVYLGEDGKGETIRIEENDRQSIVYGAFEGLRLWLENILKEQLSQKGLWAVQEQQIHIIAHSVSFDTMKEIGSVEFDEPLSEKELELLTGLFHKSESCSLEGLRWKDRNLYNRIEKKAEALLDETFGPQLSIVHIRCSQKDMWLLRARCRCMTQKDINEKQMFFDSMGEITPVREEVLAGIGNCYIWKEVWTRETGHLWEKYTLLKRTPDKEEYDYADTWDFSLVRITEFSTEAIIRMLKEYRK